MSDLEKGEEFLTVEEATLFRELFARNWTSYKEKSEETPHTQWLKELFLRELPEMTPEDAEQEGVDIAKQMDVFQENYESLQEASKHGISKEAWLEGKVKESSAGYSVQQLGETLQTLDNALYLQNKMLADGLSRS